MKISPLYLLFFLAFTSYSQNDYFVVKKDTVFCSNLEYKLTAQSYLSKISYKDLSGKEITIKKNKEIPNISTFFIDGVTIDRIPQKTSKPDKYIKWAKRVVDGKLIVNFYNSQITTYNNFHTAFSDGIITTGITKFFIKMPNGKFYDINSSKDRKQYIIPYLQKCEAFNKAYTGSFKSDYDNFTKTIELYNSLCN